MKLFEYLGTNLNLTAFIESSTDYDPSSCKDITDQEMFQFVEIFSDSLPVSFAFGLLIVSPQEFSVTS